MKTIILLTALSVTGTALLAQDASRVEPLKTTVEHLKQDVAALKARPMGGVAPAALPVVPSADKLQQLSDDLKKLDERIEQLEANLLRLSRDERLSNSTTVSATPISIPPNQDLENESERPIIVTATCKKTNLEKVLTGSVEGRYIISATGQEERINITFVVPPHASYRTTIDPANDPNRSCDLWRWGL